MAKKITGTNRPAGPKVDRAKSYEIAQHICPDIRRLFKVPDGVIIANGHERPLWAGISPTR